MIHINSNSEVESRSYSVSLDNSSDDASFLLYELESNNKIFKNSFLKIGYCETESDLQALILDNLKRVFEQFKVNLTGDEGESLAGAVRENWAGATFYVTEAKKTNTDFLIFAHTKKVFFEFCSRFEVFRAGYTVKEKEEKKEKSKKNT